MKVAISGGGPGGLYLAILLRRANPATQVVIYERNRIEDTFGFGVVLSDATEGILAEASPLPDPATLREGVYAAPAELETPHHK